MITRELKRLTEAFSYIQLKAVVQFSEDAHLPPFKGSMLHGWFGHALKARSDKLFQILFTEHSTQQPKPYLINCSDIAKTFYRRGEFFEFSITLLGQACQLHEEVAHALTNGQRLGFGKQHSKFKLISLSSKTPSGYKMGLHTGNLYEHIAHLGHPPTISNTQQAALLLNSLTRVKHHGKVCKLAPEDVQFWISQILRRLSLLSQFWVFDDEDFYTSLRADYEHTAFDIHVTQNTFNNQWQRHSLKEQKVLPFDGITGQIGFYGKDVWAILPLLKLTELIHLGGKTTFGLGNTTLLE
ncbi:CRISPR system precrRNA processing endoribonuclease RAMP protein Cas6 [Paraferrimonas haliotis]|uniref:CRISPR system precrRNA processing endoribonuclease RAMP protein Cas6 n=1 Tax=Paraferrimonas haliotis TaxID=2013866 RepID=UPI000BA90DA6|nr:CRISPR system precrRNA processing endoribonuclease RAMP protein Cas6 [Paraferrimonas haliotis]